MGISGAAQIWLVSFLAVAARPAIAAASISVYFSPNGGCTDAIVRELGQAKSAVHVMAYSFTSSPIAKALVDAHKRDVKVEAILDKSNQSSKYSSATFLYNHRVPVHIWQGSGYFHNKVIVIDGSTVITGSFNFSKRAETSNAENLLGRAWGQGSFFISGCVVWAGEKAVRVARRTARRGKTRPTGGGRCRKKSSSFPEKALHKNGSSFVMKEGEEGA